MAYYISSIEEIGIEKGLKQGLQQGIMQEKKEIARRLLIKGQSIDLISEVTEIPEHELNDLRKQI